MEDGMKDCGERMMERTGLDSLLVTEHSTLVRNGSYHHA